MTLLMAPNKRAELLRDIRRVHEQQPGWLNYMLAHHRRDVLRHTQMHEVRREPPRKFETINELAGMAGFVWILGFVFGLFTASWTRAIVVWLIVSVICFTVPFTTYLALARRHRAAQQRLTLAIERGHIVDVSDFVLNYWCRTAAHFGIEREQALNGAFLDAHRLQLAKAELRLRLGIQSDDARYRRLLHLQIKDIFGRLASEYNGEQKALGPNPQVVEAYIQLLLEQEPVG